MNILVTGGAGFIGSAFLDLMVPRHPEVHFINVDALTYAANLRNCTAVDECRNYSFVCADITDMAAMQAVFAKYTPDWVIHFAAETHVDRSIHAPGEFLRVNALGTLHLLECARDAWKQPDGHVFHLISTDEVFGALPADGTFSESSPYNPRSPYAASKAAADHMVRAFYHTYGLPIRITNCSNNYGPRQFPEKMIPLMILNALEAKPLPIYGDGLHVRDWLYVDDHCEAIWAVAERGCAGATYTIGGRTERSNLEVVRLICRILALETGRPVREFERLITFVADRQGHDRRYAIDPSRVQNDLGWQPRVTFEAGLAETVRWYLEHQDWIDEIRTGAYLNWLEINYSSRMEGCLQ